MTQHSAPGDTPDPGPQVAPGWYPDPVRTGYVRYWDGSTWGQPMPVDPRPSTVTAAGWYPDPEYDGYVRYWDGTRWGDRAPGQAGTAPAPTPNAASVSDERTLAILAHVLGILTGFIGPLILYLVAKPWQPYAKHHAAEALNFQLTLLIAWLVTVLLVLVLIGLLLVPVLIVAGFVFPIIAAVAANRGEWYRYPICIRFVRGAQG